jgi:biotin-dependent carboxylase-like uncharacterized protein
MGAIDCLEILSPGLQTTVQDTGRFGFGRFGVAPSGALDSYALRIANLLVYNPENGACLETLLMGLRIKALMDITIAVTGADLQVQIDRRPLELWRSHSMKNGQILSFLGPASGCRAYIAFGGGLQVPEIMGSLATNLPSAFGGFQGRALQAGDVLTVKSTAREPMVSGRVFKPEWIPSYPSQWTLRVMWGPQDGDFPEATRNLFIESTFSVSPESDRTGIRLDGPEIDRCEDVAESIISEGVISGSIQVPGDGKPIIILGETVTGGYRKIATVISADLPLLGQIKPGEAVRFLPVSLDEANRALSELERKVADFKESLIL